MPQVLYVYAIGRAGHPVPDAVEVKALDADGLTAFYAAVDGVEYSQAVIDARSKDLEWLGAIGYRHQSVMSALMRGGTVIPLRAFTLFANETSLSDHLRKERDNFTRILDRLDGKQEWTLRIEFRPEQWNDALVHRFDSLQKLADDIKGAAEGKAYLLRKKLDDEKKRVSRDAEEQVVAEVEETVMKKLACDTVSESRLQRGGAFPQINVLINRDEEARLQELSEELTRRYEPEGVTLALTGPWPPYSFAGGMRDEG
ncbi:MAG TPA: GvpL/GvpF family gas vesicle protein [Thermoanaerobaculia bacterium]|nr:GvpL/GvpF family gas vesicle protein [Thermoanaerobaculia bacterium]